MYATDILETTARHGALEKSRWLIQYWRLAAYHHGGSRLELHVGWLLQASAVMNNRGRRLVAASRLGLSLTYTLPAEVSNWSDLQ